MIYFVTSHNKTEKARKSIYHIFPSTRSRNSIEKMILLTYCSRFSGHSISGDYIHIYIKSNMFHWNRICFKQKKWRGKSGKHIYIYVYTYISYTCYYCITCPFFDRNIQINALIFISFYFVSHHFFYLICTQISWLFGLSGLNKILNIRSMYIYI